ncbi:MAG: calcium/sodium antiporter [Cyanobacteria bacterium P01_D01_bin.73]
MTFLLLIAGLLLLTLGADVLVRGSVRLSARFGIAPLIVGLTVVAFGTSAPELAVSIQSIVLGRDAISLGNALGSNIFNVLATLGIASIIAPLSVSQQLVRLDVPLSIGVSCLVLLFSLDGRLHQTDGFVLLAGIITYTVFMFIKGRKQGNGDESLDDYEREYGAIANSSVIQWAQDFALVAVGIGMLVGGSKLLVDNAVVLARSWGMSELVIGLTIISVGTSLPELATSVVASFKGERDIAVGNVIGSNLFNLLGVLGVAASLTPAGLPVPIDALTFDIPVALVVAVACLPIFFSGYTIDRWEGALFLGYYVAYMSYLVFKSTSNAMLPLFTTAMWGFAFPLTAITLGILAWRGWRDRQSRIQERSGQEHKAKAVSPNESPESSQQSRKSPSQFPPEST